MSRKKRRGVIEKKRRDRINSSLSELKRLVPSAYEKQGSSKLEKAEILQLTVDHLKSINARGRHPYFILFFRNSAVCFCFVGMRKNLSWKLFFNRKITMSSYLSKISFSFRNQVWIQWLSMHNATQWTIM